MRQGMDCSKLAFKLKKALISIDLFSEPISLRFSQKSSFMTLTGSCLTIIMLTILLILSNAKFDSVFNRKTTYIENYDKLNLSPPSINIKNRFAISLDPIEFNNIDLGKRYFDFFFLIGNYDNLPNGTTIKTKTYYKFSICNSTHFPNLDEKSLVALGISNWICPDFIENEDVNIFGRHSDRTYQYVQIGIVKCTNNSNYKCANESEIQELKKKNTGKIYVNLKIINNFLDVNDFEKPIIPFVDEMSFLINIKNLFIQKEVHFTKVIIQTDDSKSFDFLRNENKFKIESAFIFDRKVDEFVINEDSFLNNNSIYTSIYLKSDAKSIKINRKYDNFQALLKDLGALYSIFYIIFKFFSQILTKDLLTQEIANNLYSFSDISFFKHLNKKENSKRNSVTENLIKFKNNIFIRLKEYFWKKKLKVIGDSTYTVSQINETVEKELDIVQILLKMKQFETLKTVIFNENQKILFDFTAKPKFHIDLSKKRLLSKINSSRRSLMTTDFNIIKKQDSFFYKNIIKAYNNLMKNKDIEFNKKILDIIDKELIKKIISFEDTSSSARIKNKFTNIKKFNF